MIIDKFSPYNGILGRPWIDKIDNITSSEHQKLGYPIHGDCNWQINDDGEKMLSPRIEVKQPSLVHTGKLDRTSRGESGSHS